MMLTLRLRAICTAVFMALPLATAAQTPVEQYNAIRNIYLPAGLEPGSKAGIKAVAQYIAPLAGNWMLASKMFLGDETPDQMQDMVAKTCTRPNFLYALQVIQPYAFEMTRSTTRKDQTRSFTLRYDHISGTGFSPSYELQDFVGFLGFDLENAPPNLLLSTPPRIPVSVLQPSADTLVISNGYGPAEIYMRCP